MFERVARDIASGIDDLGAVSKNGFNTPN